MNPYFEIRATKPGNEPIDTILRFLASAVVLLVVGVGLWMAWDVSHNRLSTEARTDNRSLGSPTNAATFEITENLR